MGRGRFQPAFKGIHLVTLYNRAVRWEHMTDKAKKKFEILVFIYSNIIDKPVWIVSSALFVVGVTLVFCLAFPKPRMVASV